MMNIKYIKLLAYILLILILPACDSDDDSPLKNDFLKKTSGPVLVGSTIEFAYAIGSTDHTPLKAVEVTATYPGAIGTGIGTHGIATNSDNGEEMEFLIATQTSTEGNLSRAYLVDTIAATVRYFYVVPEEARGKSIRFKFRALTDNSSASLETPEYAVGNVEVFKNLTLTSGQNSCFSLETMRSYTLDEVESLGIADKIDFIYSYKQTLGSGWTFAHGLVAPSNNKGYLYPVEIPAGASNNTLLEKRYWPDGQLKTSGVPTIYVDEIDLRGATFDGTIGHAYELGQDQGVLIKSHDGKYVAYLYINGTSSNTLTMNFAIKRLRLN